MAPVSDDDPPPAEGLPPTPVAEPGRLSGSPHAAAAHDAVLALTKAARSFALYDPTNKVVRRLIGEYKDKIRQVLDSHGPLELAVQPFELRLGGEVVYIEQDRERSLAFRLFRDGVRSLRLETETTWSELVRLLQILSIRYTSIRQQEDDLVTLLRKAGFEHIKTVAIEGFVPEEEQAEEASSEGASARSAARYDPPEEWDLPLPPLKEMAPLRYRPVSDELLDRLRREESPEAAAANAVRAVVELLGSLATTHLQTVVDFALEVRELLKVEGRTDLLVDTVRAARSPLAATPGAFESFATAFLDEVSLRAIMDGLPADTVEPPPPLAEVLGVSPPQVTGRLVDLLAAEGDGNRAPLLRRLLTRASGFSADAVVARLREADERSRAALLPLLAELDPATALRMAPEAARSDDRETQMQALRLLQAAEFTPDSARSLRHLMESSFEPVRLAALPVMAERGGPRVTAALVAHAERYVESLSVAESTATGRAIAQSSARAALDTFRGWLEARRRDLLGRLVKMQAPAALQRVALAGLESIGGAEADALLGLLAERGVDEVAARASTAMEHRRPPGGDRSG